MTATVERIDWAPGSGIATVQLHDEDNNVALVPADAGPLFRALDGCEENILGHLINYELTDWGTLATFEVC